MTTLVSHRVKRCGCARSQIYSHALAKLQGMGYITELWVSKKGVFALYWAKKGEQWSVAAVGLVHIGDQFEYIGRNAVMWITSIERGLGTETNYAVREV